MSIAAQPCHGDDRLGTRAKDGGLRWAEVCYYATSEQQRSFPRTVQSCVFLMCTSQRDMHSLYEVHEVRLTSLLSLCLIRLISGRTD
jgi:hypothetical protein